MSKTIQQNNENNLNQLSTEK